MTGTAGAHGYMWQRTEERGGEGLLVTLIWIGCRACQPSQPWLHRPGRPCDAQPIRRGTALRRPVLRAAQVSVPIVGGYAMTLRVRVQGGWRTLQAVETYLVEAGAVGTSRVSREQ